MVTYNIVCDRLLSWPVIKHFFANFVSLTLEVTLCLGMNLHRYKFFNSFFVYYYTVVGINPPFDVERYDLHSAVNV